MASRGREGEGVSSQITCFNSKYQNIYSHSRNFPLLLSSHILSISLRVHTTCPLFHPFPDTHSVTCLQFVCVCVRACTQSTPYQAVSSILGYIIQAGCNACTPYYLCILALIHYSHPPHPSVQLFFKIQSHSKNRTKHEVFPLSSKVMKKKEQSEREKTASLLAEQSL